MGTFSYHNYLPFEKKGATPLLNCISSKWNSFPCNSNNRMNEKKHSVNSEIIDSLNQKKIAREEYGSSVLFVCRSRRLNGTVLRMRAQKPRSRATKIGSLPTQWPQAPSKGLKFAALYS